MRKLFAVALMAAMVGALGFTGTAEAGLSFQYNFRSTDLAGNAIGGSTVSGGGNTFSFTPSAAANCNPVTLAGCPVIDVLLVTANLLISAGVTVQFDTGGGLEAAFFQTWFGQGVTFNAMMNPTQSMGQLGPLQNTVDNRISSFVGVIIPPNNPPVLPTGTYNMGTVVWDTSNAATGLHLVETFVTAVDGSGSILGGNVVDTSFTEGLESGFINIIPEPATAGLLGLGLAGLVLAGRRRRA